jgi:hypothetical protein
MPLHERYGHDKKVFIIKKQVDYVALHDFMVLAGELLLDTAILSAAYHGLLSHSYSIYATMTFDA